MGDSFIVATETDLLLSTLVGQMDATLTNECKAAEFIAEHFRKLASEAGRAQPGTGDTPAIRDALRAFRASPIAERDELIKQELKIREAI